MKRKMSSANIATILAIATMLLVGYVKTAYMPSPDIGRPAGFLPDCPGVLKNTTISRKSLSLLKVVSHQSTPHGNIRRPYALPDAHKLVAADKNIDLKNKKTILYAVGYLESSILPHSQAMANTYVKKGYNVFVTETFTFLSYVYPKAVRVSRVVGRELGEFLAKLTQHGLDPENLELLGLSLGGHIISFAAKRFYALTGKKPSRITALDPSGPCFRTVPPEHRLNPTDGERVDVVHTNIDGFGNAERLGHVDFYVNGGEFQPGDLAINACTTFCSHAKSFLYWWQALENPKKFIGIQCDSVQDARTANFKKGSLTNYLGSETNFSRPGIFYLGTLNYFPYYRGEDALDPENEIFSSGTRDFNSEDVLVV
ncbi:lipase member H-A [Amyelois transitella]|uniref:lipase member H-A n=1 Tax=Amyelois transitella TaxID=680683 RepID=UPI00299015E9|nr:lipase member H-A [Amyelois transitella]